MTPIDPSLFDETGFLRDAGHWDEDLAHRIARRDAVGPLGDAHWQVIRFLREHYLRHGRLPPERTTCHDLGLDAHCEHRLFGGLRSAWRIAGLPNPGEEAETYMD